MSDGRDEIVGRGLREGGRLFREWFDSLERGREEGRGAAYVFVMGSLAELLRCFDLDLVFPEINSLQTAVRHAAAPYLNAAEEIGYSTDICGYVKADVAVQGRGGEHPMGRIPPPRVAVLTTACNTYLKWAEIWERMHDVPVLTVDVPGTRCAGAPASAAALAADEAYVAAQLAELVPRLEALTGRRLDQDRLRQNLAWSNRMLAAWQRVLAANRARPAPFNALVDGTVYLGMLNAFRGTEAGAVYFEQLAEELEHKVATGTGSLTEERFRLLFLGVPCYPIFRRFNEMFTGRGGVFVGSTYLWFASGGAHRPFAYDLEQPMASLAAGLLHGTRAAMDGMFFMERAILEMVDPYGIDGVVFHAVKSCRTTSAGMADGRRAFLAERDLPSLLLESDMMDQRVVAEAQLKNRADAFFEGMEARRLAAAAVPAGAAP